MSNPSLDPLPLPEGVHSDQLHCPDAGLSFHILESGRDAASQRPLLLLLHGFPELAFSWRKIIVPLARLGYHVVAVDQRGYGRTETIPPSSNGASSDIDTRQFTLTNLVRDMVILVHALGHREVKCVVGHDFGAVAASMCALMRPDLFRAVVLMSHPYKPPRAVPFDVRSSSEAMAAAPPAQAGDIQAELAALSEPRKHYKWYNSTAEARADWDDPPQGLRAFLRGYFHLKSADWAGNEPRPLAAWEATELAKMPKYYVMPLGASMPEAVSADMEGEDKGTTERWLSEGDLGVYVAEWQRTGFGGGLSWYRAQTNPETMKDVLLFAGRKMAAPLVFVSGAKDWGNYQQPGALEGISDACEQFRGVKFIDGAGHWPQQEQPEEVVAAISEFLRRV